MKITLIALHYGEEGSGGARRSYLWAKGLRRAGHEVHVVSPYVTGDHTYDICVPFEARGPDMHLAPTASPSFFEQYVKRHLRVWLRWPDPEISWHRNIVDIVETKVESCDWLITSSPPESAHRIGAPLAKKLNARWCVELRDSWIENSHRHYVRGLRRLIEGYLAKKWLKSSDAITSVNDQILEEARKFAPKAKALTIGHFSEPFSEVPHHLPLDTFNLVHAGGFSRSDRRRSLAVLLDALGPICLQRPNLHLHLMGPLSFEETELLARTDVKVTYHGWVPLSQSRAIQAGADALLLYTPLSGSQALPGKYAEYCNIGKPIFYFGAKDLRKMAHREDEFLEISDLRTYPKGQSALPETSLTVEKATESLLALLSSV